MGAEASKDLFYQDATSSADGGKRHLEHLLPIDDEIRVIRHEHRGMSILANLHLAMLPLVEWKLCKRKDYRIPSWILLRAGADEMLAWKSSPTVLSNIE